jgi:hypothetical protein
MIDVQNEQVNPLTIFAREVPNRAGGCGVNVSTPWRWALKGSRGVKLETVFVGGIRMTSREAGQRFYERVTAVANGDTAQTTTTKSRLKQIEAAEHEFDAACVNVPKTSHDGESIDE